MKRRRASTRGLSWPRQAWLILKKDVLAEVQTGEVVTTSSFFALLIVVIASLSFYGGPQANLLVAPGVIWVAVAFASVLALSRSWQREREFDALSGTLALPLAPSAIFVGKALGVLGFILVIEALVVPLTALLFNVSLGAHAAGLLAVCLCASPGVAAAGTLFGAMTVRTRARDLVLATVLFPLLAPTLLAAVVATRELFSGRALAELVDYFAIMGVFGGIFTTGGVGMFGTLIEG